MSLENCRFNVNHRTIWKWLQLWDIRLTDKAAIAVWSPIDSLDLIEPQSL
jgi:hypothetical protein